VSAGFISTSDGGHSWSGAHAIAGPTPQVWLVPTNAGMMVADYLSAVFVNGKPYGAFALAPRLPSMRVFNRGDLCDQVARVRRLDPRSAASSDIGTTSPVLSEDARAWVLVDQAQAHGGRGREVRRLSIFIYIRVAYLRSASSP
jgi:hypothetical protein